MSNTQETRMALPGKGTLEATTLAFLAECGMKVNRNNPRQYLARMGSIPDLELVFQRAADIPLLVQDGDAALGITGYDILAEHRGTATAESLEEDYDDDLIVLEHDLGYGSCRLVVAVPETWIDVSTCADLWHLAGYYAIHKGRGLRIATKYPALTAQFLRQHGITHCKIISPHGALEAAPLTDIADLIVDLTETGTTLRENHLKLLDDGIVLRSQACLIGNTRLLRQHERTLDIASIMLELIEARAQARNRSMLTAYLHAGSSEAISAISASLNHSLSSNGSTFDFQIAISNGHEKTVAMSVSNEAGICEYTISGVVNVKNSATELLAIVAILRSAGATNINITPLSYRFSEEALSVRTLHNKLKR
ncbi:MAG TPA: ATP phosphoribosyltransferase [Ktedonobacteraceae bacterium]|nr:ATP phosphoribosyltransferase [Ktedonobacteraceae bacterium]